MMRVRSLLISCATIALALVAVTKLTAEAPHVRSPESFGSPCVYGSVNPTPKVGCDQVELVYVPATNNGFGGNVCPAKPQMFPGPPCTPTVTYSATVTVTITTSATPVTPPPTVTVTRPPTLTVTPPPTVTVTPPPTLTVTPPATATVTPPATVTVTPPPTRTVTPPATVTVTPPPTLTATPQQPCGDGICSFDECGCGTVTCPADCPEGCAQEGGEYYEACLEPTPRPTPARCREVDKPSPLECIGPGSGCCGVLTCNPTTGEWICGCFGCLAEQSAGVWPKAGDFKHQCQDVATEQCQTNARSNRVPNWQDAYYSYDICDCVRPTPQPTLTATPVATETPRPTPTLNSSSSSSSSSSSYSDSSSSSSSPCGDGVCSFDECGCGTVTCPSDCGEGCAQPPGGEHYEACYGGATPTPADPCLDPRNICGDGLCCPDGNCVWTDYGWTCGGGSSTSYSSSSSSTSSSSDSSVSSENPSSSSTDSSSIGTSNSSSDLSSSTSSSSDFSASSGGGGNSSSPGGSSSDATSSFDGGTGSEGGGSAGTPGTSQPSTSSGDTWRFW